MVRDRRDRGPGLPGLLPVLALRVRRTGPARLPRLRALHPADRRDVRPVGAGAGHRRHLLRKKFFPDEISVQQRHDGASDEVARKTVIAQLAKAGQDTGHRAPLADQALGGRRGGDLRPRSRHRRDRAAGAQPVEGRRQGRPVDHRLGRRRPPARSSTCAATPASRARYRWSARRTRTPASMETVFPFRESERGNEEALQAALHPLRQPGDADPPAPRHPGDPAAGPGGLSTTATTTPTPRSARTWAARRRCTRRRRNGSCAPATSRSSSPPSTPSRSSVLQRAPLPQLPITVNDEGYLIASR